MVDIKQLEVEKDSVIQEVVKRAEAYSQEYDVPFDEALGHIIDTERDLFVRYYSTNEALEKAKKAPPPVKETLFVVSKQIDEKCKAYMAKNPGTSYEQARDAILEEDSSLKERYFRQILRR